jgi:anti-sigma factor RsiW
MSQEPENADTPNRIEQAEMVAYLDGELDVQQVADVEKRLSEDPEYRVRLQQLQQAWDLLDELPRSRADDQFTRSTVEIVVLKASEEAVQRAAVPAWRRWLPRLGGLLLVVAASLAGYLLSWQAATRENRQLVQDLPVIEQVSQYKQAKSLEFLRLLVEERLFETEGDNGPE